EKLSSLCDDVLDDVETRSDADECAAVLAPAEHAPVEDERVEETPVEEAVIDDSDSGIDDDAEEPEAQSALPAGDAIDELDGLIDDGLGDSLDGGVVDELVDELDGDTVVEVGDTAPVQTDDPGSDLVEPADDLGTDEGDGELDESVTEAADDASITSDAEIVSDTTLDDLEESEASSPEGVDDEFAADDDVTADASAGDSVAWGDVLAEATQAEGMDRVLGLSRAASAAAAAGEDGFADLLGLASTIAGAEVGPDAEAVLGEALAWASEQAALPVDERDNAPAWRTLLAEFAPELPDAAADVPELDPNMPLDPTGGAMPDPNTPLDPNMPLDPTGGAMPDPNTPLDPGAGAAFDGDAPDSGASEGDGWASRQLMIAEELIEPFQYMLSGLQQSCEEIEAVAHEAAEFTGRGDAAERLVAICNGMDADCEGFDLRVLPGLLELLRSIGARLALVPEQSVPELLIRVRAIRALIDQACTGLQVAMELSWPLGTIQRRVDLLLDGKRLHAELCDWHGGDPDRVLELDQVTEGFDELPSPSSELDDGTGSRSGSGGTNGAKSGGEADAPTIRINKPVLDELMNLARQLVLNKNQIQSFAGAVRRGSATPEETDRLLSRAAEYGRLVERLQAEIAVARIQPISRVIDPYRKTVNDIASIKDREVEVVVDGGETGVDKFVLDKIADPIGRIMRYAASRSIESPAEREAAGKPRVGTLRMHAEDRGSHVSILLEDDGIGATKRHIIDVMEEMGHEEAFSAEMMPEEELRVIMLQQDSPYEELAGILTCVHDAGAVIIPRPVEGWESRFEIIIPVPGAVLEVVRTAVGDERYGIPVKSIKEIVRAADHQIQSIHGTETIRVRNEVVPLIRLADRFGASSSVSDDPTALIVQAGGEFAAFLVDGILGHQEIVIDETGMEKDEQGPFLGATIEDDGRVALVVDVDQLVTGSTAA
ncbi:MAG: chemotaxis protein CheW, partial [Planctomycetota bacterium]